jgi:hypothetical protein
MSCCKVLHYSRSLDYTQNRTERLCFVFIVIMYITKYLRIEAEDFRNVKYA